MKEPRTLQLAYDHVSADERSGLLHTKVLSCRLRKLSPRLLQGGAFLRYGYPSALRGIAVIALIAAALFWNIRTSLKTGRLRN